MKKLLLFLLAAFTFYAASYAQNDPQKMANENLKTWSGKSKVISKIDKLGIAQASIYFKTATTREVLENERGAFGRKSGGGSVAGRVTAYLETTDGELAEQDFQQLSDGFYSYLNNRLTGEGIPSIEWNKIAATEFYKEEGKDLDDVKKDEAFMKKKGQLYTVVNANQGNTLWRYDITGGISPGFAFGKIKKATRFADDLDAAVIFMHLTVDFADISLDGDVKTSNSRTENMFYTKVSSSKKWKMDCEVGANVKVSGNGISMFWTQKSQSDNMMVSKDIPSNVSFASAVTEDPDKEILRKKDNIFAKDFNLNPMVITTTKAQYKAAAQKALENYADAFVAKLKLSKKD